MTGAKHAGTATYDGTRNHASLAVGQMTAMSREVNRMDRYDPHTDKFLRDTQYGILDTDVPDTNVGDMISRQAAIDVVMKCYFNDDLFEAYEYELNELPSTQPKKGKWKTAYLNHESIGIRPKVLYCSECCQCIAYPTNFCPNCGADMRGEDDG